MLLEGSCECGAVRFSVASREPYPFNLCYCRACRKTAGGGGYAINLKGDADSLQVTGREHVKTYHIRIADGPDGSPRRSPGERNFCGECGAALWAFDPRWPEMVHPFASAIDSPLPVPPERTHLMLDFKANWVEVHKGPRDKVFPLYPDESIEEWHTRLGLLEE